MPRIGWQILALLLSTSAAWAAKRAEPRPLAEGTTDEILAGYTFVGDFEPKEDTRPVSREVFWRYQYAMPKIEFPLKIDLDNPQKEMPATSGAGRAVDHLNRGRVLFLEGKFQEAKATWLGARARYSKTFPYHRRNDYMIGQAFLNIGEGERIATHKDWEEQPVKGHYANAATFLSWAFIVKTDTPDPLLDAVTPKALYNLAAVYWRYGRFAGAYGAADRGLDFLRKTGRKEFRPQFHRVLAEAFIKNRSYLEAVQELDTAIRQDRNPSEAAAAMARVGDIYFDLNNYELAEDAYGLGAKLDEDLQRINPAQLVLRGEALFWLGRFSEAQKILHFALNGSAYRREVQPLSPAYASWAALRIADAYLARKETDKARMAYYKVRHTFGTAMPARIARIREACLELPHYGGNNVKHARELLEAAKQGGDLPVLLQELAWACQVASYTERERTPEMLERVRLFAAAHPESDFLSKFVEPVRAFQAGQIEQYFKAGDVYSALSFFEKNRRRLFPKVPDALGQQLFTGYADVFRAEKAREFWPAYSKLADSDLKLLRAAVVAAELVDAGADARAAAGPAAGPARVWSARNAALQQQLATHRWSIGPEPEALAYVRRLRLTTSVAGHWPWLLKLVQAWGEKDSDYICDLEYPLLSSMKAAGKTWASVAAARVTKLIGRLMPELFKQDEACALSLLELEAAELKGDPAALAERYAKRDDWPLVGGYLHLYWTLAEHAFDAGDQASAKRMWEVIAAKGSAGAPEVQFAKARLDRSKTQFEDLWD